MFVVNCKTDNVKFGNSNLELRMHKFEFLSGGIVEMGQNDRMPRSCF
jgi:hypothetical protein